MARAGLLAEAAHRRVGEAHAEAAALALCRTAGTLDRLRTAVVTLEPCNHVGRTPPCAAALIGTPVRTIWIGARDPNPHVAGGGAAALRAAGRAVLSLSDAAGHEAARLVDACDALIAPFAKHVRTGRPWVTVKQALDRSGGMIPPAGQTTFTSAPALAYAHRLRRRADAILTGSGTVLADDPAFTVRRVPDHPGRRRLLAILDRRGRVGAAYRAAAKARGFDVRQPDSLEAALDALGAAGALEVLVEAGPTVTAAVLATDLWDEHLVIRKAAEPGRPDVAEGRRRADAHRWTRTLENDDGQP